MRIVPSGSIIKIKFGIQYVLSKHLLFFCYLCFLKIKHITIVHGPNRILKVGAQDCFFPFIYNA